MKKILMFIFEQVAVKVFASQIKKRVVLYYLKTLQVARKSLLAAFIIFSFFQLMVMGFIGTVTTAIWLLPIDDQRVKLSILLGSFTLMFFAPVFILFYFFSEKNWLKMSGVADNLIE